jgi:hypothetical protein
MRRFVKILAIFFVLLFIQSLSFYYVGLSQLEHKLLDAEFATHIPQNTDSIFVRDFYVTDCGNELNEHYSHELHTKKNELKKLLNTKEIHFQKKESFSWDDPVKKKFRIAYYTWVSHRGFPHHLFKATQEEELLIRNGTNYSKYASYQWVFLFWVKTAEHRESWNIDEIKRRYRQEIKNNYRIISVNQ